MAYWDTSALVKLYTQESDSGAFVAVVHSATERPLTCRIAVYEAHATFRRKEAEGALQAGATQRLVQQLLHDVVDGNVLISDFSGDFEREYAQCWIYATAGFHPFCLELWTAFISHPHARRE